MKIRKADRQAYQSSLILHGRPLAVVTLRPKVKDQCHRVIKCDARMGLQVDTTAHFCSLVCDVADRREEAHV